ncbi:hypothetical protein Tco_0986911 [Tanacetum coccineum]
MDPPSDPPPSQTTTTQPPPTTTTTEPPQQQPPTTAPSPQPPTPIPNPKPPIPLQPRPPFPRGPPYTQPQPLPPFPHFSSITNPSSSITSSSQRGGVSGGMAIGVPAPSPPQPNPNFSSLNPPPFTSTHFATTPPHYPLLFSFYFVRQSITGMQGAGMMGSLGAGSSVVRPSSRLLCPHSTKTYPISA